MYLMSMKLLVKLLVSRSFRQNGMGKIKFKGAKMEGMEG